MNTNSEVTIIPNEDRRDVTPFELLDNALRSGATPEVLSQLMALQERHEANIARKRFDEAMAAVRQGIKPVKKNRRVKFEAKDAAKAKTNYAYEDLASVAEMIDPVIAAHGISYRFETLSEVDKPVIVTLVIFGHGHQERNSLSAGRDLTGNKNPIQALGSTVVYLQRYLLKAGFGLAAANDDDAQAATDEPSFITEDQVTELTDLAAEVGANMPKLLEFLKIPSFAEIYADKFDAAKKVIESKRKAPAK